MSAAAVFGSRPTRCGTGGHCYWRGHQDIDRRTARDYALRPHRLFEHDSGTLIDGPLSNVAEDQVPVFEPLPGLPQVDAGDVRHSADDHGFNHRHVDPGSALQHGAGCWSLRADQTAVSSRHVELQARAFDESLRSFDIGPDQLRDFAVFYGRNGNGCGDQEMDERLAVHFRARVRRLIEDRSWRTIRILGLRSPDPELVARDRLVRIALGRADQSRHSGSACGLGRHLNDPLRYANPKLHGQRAGNRSPWLRRLVDDSPVSPGDFLLVYGNQLRLHLAQPKFCRVLTAAKEVRSLAPSDVVRAAASAGTPAAAALSIATAIDDLRRFGYQDFQGVAARDASPWLRRLVDHGSTTADDLFLAHPHVHPQLGHPKTDGVLSAARNVRNLADRNGRLGWHATERFDRASLRFHGPSAWRLRFGGARACDLRFDYSRAEALRRRRARTNGTGLIRSSFLVGKRGDRRRVGRADEK